MSVKRFIAPNMHRALELVKEEMGPDAIILSTKRCGDKVEIVTSMEQDLPTRNAEKHRKFKHQFDEELDHPLASDEAWRHQDGAQKAIEQHADYGLSQEAENSAKRLAKEIETARERMFAANGIKPEASDALNLDSQNKKQNHIARVHDPMSDSAFEFSKKATVHALKKAHNQVKRDEQLAPLKEQVEDHSWNLHDERPGECDNSHAPSLEDQRLQEMQLELAQLRQLMERQLSVREQHASDIPASQLSTSQLSTSQLSTSQGPNSAKNVTSNTSLIGNLRELGLSENVIANLVERVTPEQTLNQAWRVVMSGLAKQIATNVDDKINRGGIYAFVGPTGVGKTTTIAKLAARYALTHGADNIALLTTDTFRIGAYDQLRSLGRILNVSVHVIDDEVNLSNTLERLQHCELVLIDTAGFRQGDPLLKQQDALLSSNKQVERIFVMAANSQAQWLKASIHAYGAGGSGCVLTKLDESASLGEALSVLAEQYLPVMYVTDGQEIPNDIAVMSSQKLVAEAVKRLKRLKASEKNALVSV